MLDTLKSKAIVALVIILVAGTIALLWWRSQSAPQKQFTYDVVVAFPNLSFDQPVGVYSAGDGSDRIFVVEKKGVIHVFDNREDVTASSVFLDITDRVISAASEEDCLGWRFIHVFPRMAFSTLTIRLVVRFERLSLDTTFLKTIWITLTETASWFCWRCFSLSAIIMVGSWLLDQTATFTLR
jgi:hypothetical protein